MSIVDHPLLKHIKPAKGGIPALAKTLKVRQQRLVDLKNFDDAVVHPKIEAAIRKAAGDVKWGISLLTYRKLFVARHLVKTQEPSISTP